MGIARTLSRVGRLPARIRRNVVAVRTLRNWGEFLLADAHLAELTEVRTRGGVVLRKPAGADLKYLFDEIWLHRVYSPPGYEPRPGDLVIDVGANIGVFALYAASRSPDTTVLAYEPFPESAGSLRANVRASGMDNVRVFEMAVAAGRAPRVLDIGAGNWVMNSLIRTASAEGSESVEVDSVGLDDVFEENGVERCDLLKVDCEGSEYEIFAHCSPRTWMRIERIVVEYHEGPGMSGSGAGLSQLFAEHGFAVDRRESAGPGTGYICARNTRISGDR